MQNKNQSRKAIAATLLITLLAITIQYKPANFQTTQAAITDGMNASDLIGQYVGETPDTGVTFENSKTVANPYGLYYPEHTVIDYVNHRLFVTDKWNSRILIFNLDNNNNLTDKIADKVLGQTDMYSRDEREGANGLNKPQGITFDPAGNRLFVSDTKNNRVLIFDTSTITNGEDAVAVIGQTNFTNTTHGTSSSELYRPQGLFYDTANNRLFVADYSNNRVIVYTNASNIATTNQGGTYVIGQPDWVTRSFELAQNKLGSPTGVYFDNSRNTLFVAGKYSHRIMVFDFNINPLATNVSATNVLGQNYFHTYTSATTQAKLSNPVDITIAGNILFVSEYGNYRTVGYDLSSGITNGMNATYVLGQPDFTTNQDTATINGLYRTHGVTHNTATNELYISDSRHHRIIIHDLTNLQNNQDASDVIGQTTDDLQTPVFTKVNQGNNPFNNSSLMYPRDIELDKTNHRLFVADTSNHRILVFNLDNNNELLDKEADYVIGQDTFYEGHSTLNAHNLYQPFDMDFDAINNRLFVADSYHYRVLVFDTTTITNGMDATYVLGQADFTSKISGTTANTTEFVSSVEYDETHNILYVGDKSNYRILVFDFNNSPLTSGRDADRVIGQSSFTSNSSSIVSVSGIALDETTDSLYVALSYEDSIAKFSDASNLSQYVTSIPGSGLSYPTALSRPENISFDNSSNKLFLSDTRNHRILIYDLSVSTSPQNVLGQPDYTTTTLGLSQSQMNYPITAEYDADNGKIYVADKSNNRIMIFYENAPTVTSISPNSGSIDGGTDITITGTNFSADSTVTIDGNPATNLTVVNSTEITATTPAGTITGPRTIQVSTEQGNDTSTFSYADTFSASILGNGATDYILTAPTAITFSETLTTTQQTEVETALTFGTNQELSFQWSNNDTVTISSISPATFEHDVIAYLSDLGPVVLIDSALTENEIEASPVMTLTSDNPDVVVTNPDNTLDLTVPSTVNNATINLNTITTSNGGNIPAINVTSSTTTGDVDVAIPSSTLSVTSDNWDDKLYAPSVQTISPPYAYLPNADIESIYRIGGKGASLNFDHAVRINFKGQAAKQVGYYTNGTFSPITEICEADTQLVGDALNDSCKMNSGSDQINGGGDLIVWTKHFSDFFIYINPPTISTITPNNGGEGGNELITITGNHFYNGTPNMTVKIDNNDCTNINIISSTELTCLTPIATSLGMKDVTLTTQSGTNTYTDAYTYHEGDYTKLLLHMDGANDSTTFSDSSNSNHSITAYNNARISNNTTKSNFAQSGNLHWTGNDMISTPDSNDWYFSNENFTIDFWVNYSLAGNDGGGFISQIQDNNNFFIFSQSSDELKLSINAGGVSKVFPVSWNPSSGQWYHLALERYNNFFYIYINGTKMGWSTAITIPNFYAPLNIGTYSLYLVEHNFPGYMDELRISKGIARYKGTSFTPPTEPYDTDTNIINVSPSEAPRAGGTQITIVGSNFTTATDVTIGSESCTNINVVDNNHIVCDTAAMTPGTYDLTVLTSNHGNATITNGFTVHPYPTIEGVIPAFGSPSGGTTVSIVGTDIRDIENITFDGLTCTNITEVSTEEVTCVTPEHASGQVDVVVSSTGTSNTLQNGFTYTIFAVTQKLGDNTADYVLPANTTGQIIFSKHLDQTSKDAVINRINAVADQIINYQWTENGDEQILSLTAANEDILFEDDVRVRITSTDGDSLYYPILIDSALDLNQQNSKLYGTSRLSEGPNEIVIISDSYHSINNSEENATLNLNPMITIDNGVIPSITVSSPLESRNTYLAIQSLTQTSSDSSWNQRINLPKTSTATIPNVTATGTPVTINSAFSVGSDTQTITFDKAVRLKITQETAQKAGYFDGVELHGLPLCFDDSEATGNALAPDGACYLKMGSDMIIWTKHFSDFVTYNEGFEPEITNVLPSQGNEAGGTKVTITGTNFGTGAIASFGGTDAISTYVVDNTQILAETPAGTGIVDVTVTNTDTNSGTLTNGFEYVAAADPTDPALDSVTPITPATGATTGGDTVTITGTNFTDPTSVYFGSSAGTGISYDSSTQLSGTTPAHASGAVDLIVINSNGQWDITQDAFTYTGGSAGGGCGDLDPNQQCGILELTGTTDIFYQGYPDPPSTVYFKSSDTSAANQENSLDITADNWSEEQFIGIIDLEDGNTWTLQVRGPSTFTGTGTNSFTPTSVKAATSVHEFDSEVFSLSLTDSSNNVFNLSKDASSGTEANNLLFWTSTGSSYTWTNGHITAPMNNADAITWDNTAFTHSIATDENILVNATDDGEVGIFGTGINYSIGIPGGTPADTYTGTITYTLI